METSTYNQSGYPYACIYGHLVNPSVNQTVPEDECKESWFTCFYKYNINQTFTNGSGMIPGVRIAIFTEIRDFLEELIAFLSIGPQKLEILTIRPDASLSKSISIQLKGISMLASQVI